MPLTGGSAVSGQSRTGYKARYVAVMDCAVGSATLPQGSLYAVAATGFSLLECAFARQGAAAQLRAQLTRLTSLGTAGATGAVAKFDDDASAAQCLPVNTHTVAPGLGDAMHAARLPTSAQTAGWFGFYDEPIEVPVGTANGIGWLPLTASGAADVHFVWEE